MLEPASAELINQELKFPRSAYAFKKASENMEVVSSYESLGSLVDWSFK